MPHVNVGGSRCRVSWAEYAAAIMPKGALVWFRVKTATGMKEGCGAFLGAKFYDDSVSARVQSGNDTIHVFPTFSDRIRRAKAHEVADHIGGEGI